MEVGYGYGEVTESNFWKNAKSSLFGRFDDVGP